MKEPEKVTSYILVRREAGEVYYWQYGQGGGWTEDLKNARRYAREMSAAYARHKLLKRPGLKPEDFRVEAIEE